MIRLPDSQGELTPIERYGLAVLVDNSRLLPVSDPTADVVRLGFAGNPSDATPDMSVGRPSHQVVRDGEVVLQRSYLVVLGELAGGVFWWSASVRCGGGWRAADGAGSRGAGEDPGG